MIPLNGCWGNRRHKRNGIASKVWTIYFPTGASKTLNIYDTHWNIHLKAKIFPQPLLQPPKKCRQVCVNVKIQRIPAFWMYFNFHNLSSIKNICSGNVLSLVIFGPMHWNPFRYMKISLTKPALHFPAAIYWHFSHRAKIHFLISWNSASSLYFCLYSFVFLYFPYIDISLTDPKFNFRSPEIVKVLWYDRLHQLNMNGQENMFWLFQYIDFLKGPYCVFLYWCSCLW